MSNVMLCLEFPEPEEQDESKVGVAWAEDEVAYQVYEIGSLRFKLKSRFIPPPPGDTLITEMKPAPLRLRYLDDAYQILQAIYQTLDDDQEHLVILCTANRVVRGYKVISSGGRGFVALDASIIFRTALFLGANELVLAHNHPCQNSKPSAEDITVTEDLIYVGNILNIKVLDHLIYTPRGYSSVRAIQRDIFG